MSDLVVNSPSFGIWDKYCGLVINKGGQQNNNGKCVHGSQYVITTDKKAIAPAIYPTVTFHPYSICVLQKSMEQGNDFAFATVNILIWDWAGYRGQIAVLVPNYM